MTIEEKIKQIHPVDQGWRKKATEVLESLAMPKWALGKIMDLSVDLVGITQSLEPSFQKRLAVVMAADHGIAAEGVSAYPAEVTRYIVRTIARGGAGINVLAKAHGAKVRIVDMGVAVDLSQIAGCEEVVSKNMAAGTENFMKGRSMSIDAAKKCVEHGFDLAVEYSKSCDIFCAGEMGIANTTSATAILCALTSTPPLEVTGRGTGLDDEGLQNKIKVLEKALLAHREIDKNDGWDVLSRLGGFEIGGLAGLMLGAAHLRKPVVLDGFISTAAALIAQVLNPQVTDYMLASHQSVEKGHQMMLDRLGKKAILDLNFRLGEGTGAVMLLPLIDSAVAVLKDMITLEQALAE